MKELLYSEEYRKGFKNVDEMIIRLKELRDGFVIDMRGHEEAYKTSSSEEDKEYHSCRIDHFTDLIDAYTERIDLLERTIEVRRSDLCTMLTALGDYRNHLETGEERGEYYMEWYYTINDLYNKIDRLI